MFLAKLVGLYLVIMSVALFLRAKDLNGILKEFHKHKGLEMMMGIIAVIFGLLVVLTHNVWDTLWQGFISLVGWSALVKGILVLWAPESFYEIAKGFDHESMFRVGAFVVYVMGAFILAKGFGFV